MESAKTLAEWVSDARQRTMDLVADLTDDQLMGPSLDTVNPLRWEIGHMAWFQEKWVLRHVGKQAPYRKNVDALYDSIAIPHDDRWDLPLPSREETLTYIREVRDQVLERVEQGLSDKEAYHILYSVFHEDMHTEAFTYTRQTLGYPPPELAGVAPGPSGGGRLDGDVEIPGGEFMLGAGQDEPFVFDNEKWAHPVTLKPFSIARAPVTQAEFAAFVEDRGYDRKELWREGGWEWRETERADHPVYWRKESGGEWQRRDFDRWVPLESDRPVIHVNWFEAEAYCAWAGRRLPTEAEWEAAAACGHDGGSLSKSKRRFPWGDEGPESGKAHLDWRDMGCAEVGAYPEAESTFGCRQMIGNVWEWTSSVFLPYPGFIADPYEEYSEPWFETRKVLRGGSWATRSRMLRNTWRNYFTPDRRDVMAGLRTVAKS